MKKLNLFLLISFVGSLSLTGCKDKTNNPMTNEDPTQNSYYMESKPSQQTNVDNSVNSSTVNSTTTDGTTSNTGTGNIVDRSANGY